MKFTFCPTCGTQLIQKPIGDEGPMPFCPQCSQPVFDTFPCAFIALVTDGRGHILLLRQDYISSQYANLVSGYMKMGESAESCARREILEETGLEVTSLTFAGTYWYARKQMLMIGFFATAAATTQTIGGEPDNQSTPPPLHLSAEVPSASWVPAWEALSLVHPPGSVSHSLVKAFLS